jgi:hypothetical protein
VCLVVAHAIFYIFETTFSDKSEPACWVTLTLQLVTLAVRDFLTLPFAELPQHLKINTVIAEFLFHKSVVNFWLQRYKKFPREKQGIEKILLFPNCVRLPVAFPQPLRDRPGRPRRPPHHGRRPRDHPLHKIQDYVEYKEVK